MDSMTGIVTLVQEGRFQMCGDDGGTRLFVLAHGAPLEPQDLPPLLSGGVRVTVHYEDAADLVAAIAHGIDLADGRNR